MRNAGRATGALLATATAAALLVAGCEPAGGAGDEGGDCAWQLAYDGRTYLPLPGGVPIPDTVHHHGSPLGEARFVACDDHEGDATGEQITVYPIKGVAPELAVMTHEDEIGLTDPAHVPPAVQALLGTPAAAG